MEVQSPPPPRNASKGELLTAPRSPAAVAAGQQQRRRDSVGSGSGRSRPNSPHAFAAAMAAVGQQHVRADRANSVTLEQPPTSAQQQQSPLAASAESGKLPQRRFGTILSIALDLVLGSAEAAAPVLEQLRPRIAADAAAVAPDAALPLLRELRREVKRETHQAKRDVSFCKAQGLLRTALARARFARNRAEYAKGRNEPLRELHRNEKRFVGKLKTLVDLFETPLLRALEAKQPIASREALRTIFGPCPELLALHEEILAILERTLESWPVVRGLGQRLLAISSRFKIYGEYVSNCPASVATCLRLEQSEKRFASFLQHQSQSLVGPMAGVQLVDLLPCALNQIAQYDGTLHAMIEATSAAVHSLEEIEGLTKAAEFMSRLSEVVQVSFEQSHNRLKVVQAITQLGGPSHKGLEGDTSSRRHVGEWELEIISKRVAKKSRKRHLFLFSDIAVFAKPSTKGENMFRSKEIVKLDELDGSLLASSAAADGGGGGSFDSSPQQSDSSFVLSTPHFNCVVVMPTAPSARALSGEISKLLRGSHNETQVFGSDLHSLLNREDRLNSVPIIVEKLCAYLEGCLDTTGLFRVTPNLLEARELKQLFDKGWRAETSINRFSPHTAAHVLKSFFREMPEPVITFRLYDAVMATGDLTDEEQRATKLTNVLASMPLMHLNLLRFLMLFLRKVAAHSSENLMSERNLSMMFAPNILRPKLETVESTLDLPRAADIVETMISSTRMWLKRSGSISV